MPKNLGGRTKTLHNSVFERTMNPEDPTSFFAIKLDTKETPQSLVRVILRIAHEARLLFWTLDVLDTIEIGGSTYLRFRTDLSPQNLANRLLSWGHTIVLPNESGSYILRHPQGKQGNVPMMSMCQTTRPGYQKSYRGTRHWEALFAS